MSRTRETQDTQDFTTPPVRLSGSRWLQIRSHLAWAGVVALVVAQHFVEGYMATVTNDHAAIELLAAKVEQNHVETIAQFAALSGKLDHLTGQLGGYISVGRSQSPQGNAKPPNFLQRVTGSMGGANGEDTSQILPKGE